jgi:hypothetical protein
LKSIQGGFTTSVVKMVQGLPGELRKIVGGRRYRRFVGGETGMMQAKVAGAANADKRARHLLEVEGEIFPTQV